MSDAGIVLVTAIVVAALLCLYVVWRQRRNRTKRLIGDLLSRGLPGEAQVDFFEVVVEVGGERRKAWEFLLRLMYSGREFAWL